MKKIISFFLAAMLILSCSVSAVYIPQDVRGTEFESDVELMINLGLLEYSEEGMFKPYSHMTRAEFAQLLDGLLASKSVSSKDAFIDVDRNHYAHESINRLYEYGYVNGNGNSYFRAEDDITYNEAVRVMVSIMGYDQMAQYYGGYPSGYLAVAGDIGIGKGVVPDGEYINRGNIIKLLINCFEANPVEIKFKDGQIWADVNEDVTVLSELTGIYKVKDYVNSNSDYAFSGKLAHDGYIYIGGEEMKSPPEYEDYVGYMVNCYYRETEDDEYKVVYLEILDSKNKLLKVNAEDVYEADSYSCRVYDKASDKEKTLKFNAETIFIYNGRLCPEFDKDMLLFENGWIEFLDNNDNGVYDIVRMNEYYNIVVELVTDEKIYSKYDANGTIDIDGADVRAYDAEGNVITPAEISAGNVLSVFKSGDSKEDDIIKLVCSDKTLSGIVKDKEVKGGITYVTIAEEVCAVYSGYRTTVSTEISLMDSGEFLLDAYGKVTSMKGAASGVYIPAFLIQVKSYTDEDSGEDLLRFKVSTENGVLYVYSYDRVKVDGIPYQSAAFENLGKSLQSNVGKVILYKLNSKGNVTSIDTVEQNAKSADDRLTAGPTVAPTTSLRYHGATRVFEGQFPLAENVKVFVVPKDLTNARDIDFAVRDASYFGNGSNLTTYRLDSKKLPVDYVVAQGTTQTINHLSDIALVKNISTTINSDDETVAEIKVNVYGQEKTFITSDMRVLDDIKYITKYARSGDTLVDFESGLMPEIGVGDIIKYSINANGAIDGIAIVYSAAKDKMYSVNPYHTDFLEQGYRYVQGTVSEKYEDYIMLDVNNGSRTECHRIGMAPIYEVDTDSKNMLKQISIADIKDSDTYGVGDTVIILMTTGSQLMTLLYK